MASEANLIELSQSHEPSRPVSGEVSSTRIPVAPATVAKLRVYARLFPSLGVFWGWPLDAKRVICLTLPDGGGDWDGFVIPVVGGSNPLVHPK